MAKEWYEEDDNESVWWKATRKNTHKICPDYFLGGTGFGANVGTGAEISSFLKNLGLKTEIASLVGATTGFEKAKLAAAMGFTFCAGAYLGGGLDAWYQVNHDGRHALSDKWNFDTQAVQNLLVGIDRKWKKDLHNVEFFLKSASEWWKP